MPSDRPGASGGRARCAARRRGWPDRAVEPLDGRTRRATAAALSRLDRRGAVDPAAVAPRRGDGRGRALRRRLAAPAPEPAAHPAGAAARRTRTVRADRPAGSAVRPRAAVEPRPDDDGMSLWRHGSSVRRTRSTSRTPPARSLTRADDRDAWRNPRFPWNTLYLTYRQIPWRTTSPTSSSTPSTRWPTARSWWWATSAAPTAQLEERANQLAHHLLAQGIGRATTSACTAPTASSGSRRRSPPTRCAPCP